ncbi:hypothetical protein KI387_030222, partial [Taxus chinensis]
RLPLVAWDKVTLPKGVGGLGLKDIKSMNLALMAKIGWWLEHEQGLWVRILKSKYLMANQVTFVSNDVLPEGSIFWNGL